jgi:hypothetical protein
VDHDTVLAAFDRQMRQQARPDSPGALIERAGRVVRQTDVAEGWSGILWSDLDQDTADAAIADQIRHFTALGREFEWKLYAHDHPGDLAERLRAAGFTPEPAEALMVAEVEALTTDAALPEGITLRRVTDPDDVELMADVHEQAFGTGHAFTTHLLRTRLAEAPDTVAAVVAMAGDQPVCAARLEFHEGTQFAGLWGGGTVTAWRGRGIYRALVALRARIAAERGYRYLQVDASEQSRPILHGLGFAPLSTTTPYLYRP